MDPFEITQRDSSSPVAPSSPPVSPGSQVVSTIAGTLVSLGAMSAIFIGWMRGEIPVWWHAVGALLVATLPTSDLARLARAAAKRIGGGK